MPTTIMRQAIIIIFAFIFTLNPLFSDLPIKPPEKEGYIEIPEGFATRSERYIRNLYKPEWIFNGLSGYYSGLVLNLSKITKLLDGRTINPKNIYGKVYYGPYPFEIHENQYTYKRFRKYSRFIPMTAKAFLNLETLFEPSYNCENWSDRGQLMLRVSMKYITDDEDLGLGTYDLIVRFKKENNKFKVMNTVSEGPFVNLTNSSDPSKITIAFKTTSPVRSYIRLKNGKKTIEAKSGTRHEVVVANLKPDTLYHYKIGYNDFLSREYSFRTAPEKGKGRVVFAYSGDSREGVGGGEANFMGMNYMIAERTANLAYRKNADLFIFGGDLMNGNTTSPDDYRTQLYAFKQAFSGFWHHRPVYACMGNHESLLRTFENDNGELLRLDRWPYATESSEAVFADELVLPENGPVPSDPNRPSYKESVYSFQYGPIKFIAFNNNYWIAKAKSPLWQIPKIFGGCPEGYIMNDQMEWIEKELEKGEKNPTVKYIILFAQEPVIPNGGHIQDCMWYLGNNQVSAVTYDSKTDKLIPEKEGIIDVRNRLLRLVGKNRKVAAVLGSDEHSYHKTLIDNSVPVGDPKKDDKEGFNMVCLNDNSCSTLKDLEFPTWYIVSGGSGAPYYSEEPTPWNRYWKKNPQRYKRSQHTSMRGCYYYSSQENMMLFTADENKISVIVYNPYGGIIDRIDNLMKIKKI